MGSVTWAPTRRRSNKMGPGSRRIRKLFWRRVGLRNKLGECRRQQHDLTGYFFNPEVQFSTMVMGDVLAAASSLTVLSKNRPSAATS